MKNLTFFIFANFIFLKPIYAQQGVGIGPSAFDPKATLHVNGTVRVDSVFIDSTTSIGFTLTLDSNNVLSKKIINNQDLSLKVLLPFGESIQKGDAVSLGDGFCGYYTTYQNDISQVISLEDSTYAIAQTFLSSSDAFGIRAVTLRIGNSKALLKVSIQKVENGIPDGNTLGSTVLDHPLESDGPFLFVFNPPITVLPQNEYAIVLNFIKNKKILVYGSTSNSYLGGYQGIKIGNQNWQMTLGRDLMFEVYETKTKSGFVFKSKAQTGVIGPYATTTFFGDPDTYSNSDKTDNFIGFALESGSPGEIKPVVMSGIVNGFSNLKKGRTYYLSDIVPGLITDVKSYPVFKRVGIAVSGSELLLRP